MTGVLRLPARGRVARPWRNGGGITHDIVALPAGAGDDDFLWRASIATIAGDGPFSAWPGIDRTLWLLHGRLSLAIGGKAARTIDSASPAQCFAGEEQVFGRPIDGACTVFNLMARRGKIRTRVERWTGQVADVDGDRLLLADTAATARVGGEVIPLEPGDALLVKAAHAAGLEIDHPIILCAILDGAKRTKTSQPN